MSEMPRGIIFQPRASFGPMRAVITFYTISEYRKYIEHIISTFNLLPASSESIDALFFIILLKIYCMLTFTSTKIKSTWRKTEEKYKNVLIDVCNFCNYKSHLIN